MGVDRVAVGKTAPLGSQFNASLLIRSLGVFDAIEKPKVVLGQPVRSHALAEQGDVGQRRIPVHFLAIGDVGDSLNRAAARSAPAARKFSSATPCRHKGRPAMPS